MQCRAGVKNVQVRLCVSIGPLNSQSDLGIKRTRSRDLELKDFIKRGRTAEGESH